MKADHIAAKKSHIYVKNHIAGNISTNFVKTIDKLDKIIYYM